MTYCWVAVPRYERAISIGRVLNMAAFALRLERMPVARLPAPDAILVSSPSLFPLPVASRWARRAGARLAFEVRDIWPLTLRELGGLPAWHPLVVLMQWLEDYGYRRADRVVSVLPAAADHMVSRGMDPRKFHYLPNGIELMGAPVNGAAPSAVRDAVRAGVFTVGFVGTLGRANVLETLVDAARLLGPDEAQVVIVGHGPERDQLTARAKDLRNLTFVGPVPKPQVPAALALFDACYVGYRRSSAVPLRRLAEQALRLHGGRTSGALRGRRRQPAGPRVRLRAHGPAGGPGRARRRDPVAGRLPAGRARAARRQRARLRRGAPRLRAPGRRRSPRSSWATSHDRA